MHRRIRIAKILGVLSLAFLSASCGGGSSSGNTGTGSTGSNGGGSTLTNQERATAAQTTATSNQLCTTLTPFYWEIGDASGALVSGTGGDSSGAPPGSATLMAIASASKWVFSSYALEKLDVSQSSPLSATDVQYLNFTSGYVNMSDSTCLLTTSVGACFGAGNLSGGNNNDQTAADVGKFF